MKPIVFLDFDGTLNGLETREPPSPIHPGLFLNPVLVAEVMDPGRVVWMRVGPLTISAHKAGPRIIFHVERDGGEEQAARALSWGEAKQKTAKPPTLATSDTRVLRALLRLLGDVPTVPSETPAHDLTDAEVALAKELAAHLVWLEGDADPREQEGTPREALHTLKRVTSALCGTFLAPGRLSVAGRALLERAKKAGVL